MKVQPCRSCGKLPKVMFNPDPYFLWIVQCSTDPAIGVAGHDSEEEAVKSWNKYFSG